MFQHAKQGTVDVIGCDRPVDAEVAEQFAVFARQHIAAGQPRLVLDLSETPIVDSAGLETILQLHDDCTPRGGQMRIASPTPLVRDILEVTHVADSIEVFDDLSEAVGSFAQ
jgi:stage II sporulation protein AA (anti-sigma F factor antagonist)